MTSPLTRVTLLISVADDFTGASDSQGAGFNRSSLGRKAKKAGMTAMAFSRQKQDSPGKLGKQSRLAETLSKLRRKNVVSGG